MRACRDPKQRPSAQKALEHPWVQGRKKQRTEGKPLAGTIVQRLQVGGAARLAGECASSQCSTLPLPFLRCAEAQCCYEP